LIAVNGTAEIEAAPGDADMNKEALASEASSNQEKNELRVVKLFSMHALGLPGTHRPVSRQRAGK